MDDKVWITQGSMGGGEGSGWYDWNVAAFDTEQEAQEYAQVGNKLVKELKEWLQIEEPRVPGHYVDEKNWPPKFKKYDPNMETGVEYQVEFVKFKKHRVDRFIDGGFKPNG